MLNPRPFTTYVALAAVNRLHAAGWHPARPPRQYAFALWHDTAGQVLFRLAPDASDQLIAEIDVVDLPAVVALLEGMHTLR